MVAYFNNVFWVPRNDVSGKKNESAVEEKIIIITKAIRQASSITFSTTSVENVDVVLIPCCLASKRVLTNSPILAGNILLPRVPIAVAEITAVKGIFLIGCKRYCQRTLRTKRFNS